MIPSIIVSRRMHLVIVQFFYCIQSGKIVQQTSPRQCTKMFLVPTKLQTFLHSGSSEPDSRKRGDWYRGCMDSDREQDY